jgi:hypothetical protein
VRFPLVVVLVLVLVLGSSLFIEAREDEEENEDEEESSHDRPASIVQARELDASLRPIPIGPAGPNASNQKRLTQTRLIDAKPAVRVWALRRLFFSLRLGVRREESDQARSEGFQRRILVAVGLVVAQ